MVKHFISAVFALFMMATATTISAQSNSNDFGKNEFQFNFGAGAMSYDKDDCGVFARNQISQSDDILTYVSFGVDYMHNFNDRFGMGAGLSVGAGVADITNDIDNKIGNTTDVNLTALVNARYYWIHKKHFGLYSKVGLGAEHYYMGVDLKDNYKKNNAVNDDDLNGKDESRFAFNIAPVGVDFGGKKVRGFVEPEIANHRFTFNAGVKLAF